MALATLVDVVNNVMRRAKLLNSQSDVLTDFTDTALRPDIDSVIDAINDTFRYAYDLCKIPPYGTSEGTLTVVTSQREYAVSSSTFYKMKSCRLVNQTTGHYLLEYPGGYPAMFEEQVIPSSYTGQPTYWALNQVTGDIRLDTAPTSDFNGDVYKYLYTTQLNYEAYDDAMPMPEMVIRDLIPAMVQMYQRNEDPRKYDRGVFDASIAMGVSGIMNQPIEARYANG